MRMFCPDGAEARPIQDIEFELQERLDSRVRGQQASESWALSKVLADWCCHPQALLAVLHIRRWPEWRWVTTFAAESSHCMAELCQHVKSGHAAQVYAALEDLPLAEAEIAAVPAPQEDRFAMGAWGRTSCGWQADGTAGANAAASASGGSSAGVALQRNPRQTRARQSVPSASQEQSGAIAPSSQHSSDQQQALRADPDHNTAAGAQRAQVKAGKQTPDRASLKRTLQQLRIVAWGEQYERAARMHQVPLPLVQLCVGRALAQHGGAASESSWQTSVAAHVQRRNQEAEQNTAALQASGPLPGMFACCLHYSFEPLFRLFTAWFLVLWCLPDNIKLLQPRQRLLGKSCCCLVLMAAHSSELVSFEPLTAEADSVQASLELCPLCSTLYCPRHMHYDKAAAPVTTPWDTSATVAAAKSLKSPQQAVLQDVSTCAVRPCGPDCFQHSRSAHAPKAGAFSTRWQRQAELVEHRSNGLLLSMFTSGACMARSLLTGARQAWHARACSAQAVLLCSALLFTLIDRCAEPNSVLVV